MDGRSQILRPSPRTVHALLHGDVGAVLVLRPAPAARVVHVGHRNEWRLRVRSNHGVSHRRDLRCVRLPHVAARRLGRRPSAGTATRDLHRRVPDLVGTHLHRPVRASRSECRQDSVLPRSDSHRLRNRTSQAEHLRDRRRLVSRGWRTPRRGILDLLHGNQRRRVPRSARDRLPRRAGGLARRHGRRWRRDAARVWPTTPSARRKHSVRSG